MFELYKNILRRKTVFNSTVGAAVFFMSVGVIYWGGFNTALEVTNDMDFCISCHEMEENVYQEYITTIHYKNRTGVRAGCPDCHVPREWEHMLTRKISASQELIHKALGTISTPEKFASNRERMAKSVWKSMEGTDSRECRNCHDFEAMDGTLQNTRSRLVHTHAQKRKKTCINCHKGIAHTLPTNVTIEVGGSDEDHDYYEKEGIECYLCHEDMNKPNTEDWD